MDLWLTARRHVSVTTRACLLAACIGVPAVAQPRMLSGAASSSTVPVRETGIGGETPPKLAGEDADATLNRYAPKGATPRPALWVDELRGEPITFAEILSDLQHTRVIYLGEYHTIPRHHELQKEILEDLAGRGVRLVLAMEQFETFNQPALDRFNSGAIDLDALIIESHLSKRWPGHTIYHGLLTSARLHGIPVLALNARSELIRAVGKSGLSNLAPELRKELPESL